MNTEKVFCGGSEHELELRPVTILFNAAQKDIIYQDRVPVTPDMTLAHFDTLSTIDPYSACLFRIVVNDYKFPITIKQIKESVLAFKHLIGLFSLSFKLMLEGQKFVWKYPESFLHPKYQGNVAEVIILMSNPDEFTKFIRCVQKGYFDDFIVGTEGLGESVLKRLSGL